MNYSLATNSSKILGFVKHLDQFALEAKRRGMSPGDASAAIWKIWGNRMDEWGWDSEMFLDLWEEFYSGRCRCGDKVVVDTKLYKLNSTWVASKVFVCTKYEEDHRLHDCEFKDA